MRKVVLALSAVVLLSYSMVYAVDGFASENGGTTGGAGGATVTVTNGADFLTYVEEEDTPYIIQISGTVELSEADGGRVRIQSNKTIKGIGDNPTIIGSLGFKNKCRNVIIEGLTVTCPDGYTSEEDGISVKDDIENVFITKCTLFDCYDGCIDVARRSDWVTISWCRFYFNGNNGNNNRVSLIGNSDGASDDLGHLHVTLHHNWYDKDCMQRIPSVRYGRVHIYNNYYDCQNEEMIYCVWSRIQAECLIENNYFKEVNNPYVNNRDGAPVEEWGKIGASGNIIDNCTGDVHDGTDVVFDPPYDYSLDDANFVPAIVKYSAGADGKEGTPPHWYFGQYGDFDMSGFVDIVDFASFATYWLGTENIENADYDESGRVDLGEFAMFSGNYMYVAPDTTAPEVPADLWALGQDGQISLDWSENNTEADFAGYNLYRSTSPSSGFVKVNGMLLQNSKFNDIAVTNGTMYFYEVKSLDTSGNESVGSILACAVPGTTNLLIQEEALGFCMSGDIQTIETKNSGFTGLAYANTYNETGMGVDYSVNITTAGTYTLTFRYAGTTNRTANLIVNGVTEVTGIPFVSTGAWTSWATETVMVDLSAGVKSIRLEATTGDGLSNIDYMQIEGAGPEATVCP